MNCNNIKEYIKSLNESESPSLLKDENFYLEFYGHIEICNSCNKKYGLNYKLLYHIDSYYKKIEPTPDLQNKIFESLKKEKSKKAFNLKNYSIAASFILVFSLCLFVENKLPSTYEIHNNSNYKIISTDLDLIISHTGEGLEKHHFINLEKAEFIPHGATKINKLFNRSVSLIALKNTKGQKLTLGFFPKDYTLKHNDFFNINGIKVFHGKSDNQHFAYWEKNQKKVVLISDSLLPNEMVDLASPLITTNIFPLVE